MKSHFKANEMNYSLQYDILKTTMAASLIFLDLDMKDEDKMKDLQLESQNQTLNQMKMRMLLRLLSKD